MRDGEERRAEQSRAEGPRSESKGAVSERGDNKMR